MMIMMIMMIVPTLHPPLVVFSSAFEPACLAPDCDQLQSKSTFWWLERKFFFYKSPLQYLLLSGTLLVLTDISTANPIPGWQRDRYFHSFMVLDSQTKLCQSLSLVVLVVLVVGGCLMDRSNPDRFSLGSTAVSSLVQTWYLLRWIIFQSQLNPSCD